MLRRSTHAGARLETLEGRELLPGGPYDACALIGLFAGSTGYHSIKVQSKSEQSESRAREVSPSAVLQSLAGALRGTSVSSGVARRYFTRDSQNRPPFQIEDIPPTFSKFSLEIYLLIRLAPL